MSEHNISVNLPLHCQLHSKRNQQHIDIDVFVATVRIKYRVGQKWTPVSQQIIMLQYVTYVPIKLVCQS